LENLIDDLVQEHALAPLAFWQIQDEGFSTPMETQSLNEKDENSMEEPLGEVMVEAPTVAVDNLIDDSPQQPSLTPLIEPQLDLAALETQDSHEEYEDSVDELSDEVMVETPTEIVDNLMEVSPQEPQLSLPQLEAQGPTEEIEYKSDKNSDLDSDDDIFYDCGSKGLTRYQAILRKAELESGMTYAPFPLNSNQQPTLVELELPYFVEKQVDPDDKSVMFFTRLVFRSMADLPITYKVWTINE
jgi:hypothetical protein